jgi:hypothetical protein
MPEIARGSRVSGDLVGVKVDTSPLANKRVLVTSPGTPKHAGGGREHDPCAQGGSTTDRLTIRTVNSVRAQRFAEARSATRGGFCTSTIK